MIGNLEVRARTALSPEWDHGFDEAFAELVSSDPDLVQAEFDDLIASSWTGPADAVAPPDPPAPAVPESSPDAAAPGPAGVQPSGETSDGSVHQRPPPP